jgi:hypothetical protein
MLGRNIVAAAYPSGETFSSQVVEPIVCGEEN